jgi:hypothetical protein
MKTRADPADLLLHWLFPNEIGNELVNGRERAEQPYEHQDDYRHCHTAEG